MGITQPTYQQLLEKLQTLEHENAILKTNQKALDTSPAFIMLLASDGKVLSMNDLMLKTLGYKRKEVIGKNYIETFIPVQNRSSQNEWFSKHLKPDSSNTLTNYVLKKGGETISIYWRIGPIVENEPNIKARLWIGFNSSETNETEEELKRTLKEYNIILDNAPAFIIFKDSKNNILRISETVAKMTGLPRHEIEGRPSKEIYPDMANTYYKDDFEVLQSGKPKKGIIEPLPTVKGGQKWLLTDKIPYFDDNNNVAGIIVFSSDITRIKEAELSLIQAKEKAEESDFRLKLAIESGELGIWDLDLTSNALQWNDKMYELYGISKDKFTNNFEAWENGLHPDDKEQTKDAFNLAISGQQKFDTTFRVVHPDNTILHIKATGNILNDKAGNPIRIIGTNRDITTIKTHENELIEAKEKAEKKERELTEAQKLTHVGNWEYFLDGDIVYWSRELYNIFELPFDLPAPKYSEQAPFYSDDSFAKLDEAVQACLQNTTPYELELDIITSSGKIKHIISKGEPKQDANNKIIGCYGTAQDITERKIIEHQLLKAKEKAEEADHLKSAFLANMSHEIRTPMNGILGFSSLLKNPALSEDEKEKYLDIIEASGLRMLNTINDIIDISKIESKQVELSESEVNMNTLLTDMYDFFLPEVQEKNIQLFFKNKSDSQQIIINSDKAKLNSIFTNLIKNAIKYTHAGQIEFGYLTDKNEKQQELRFFVKDTGIGIPQNRHIAIFERFVQADIDDINAYEGSGLGLAITKAYVEMLGGRIWVESKTENGSTFYFTLPYQSIQIEKSFSNPQNDEQFATNQKTKILITEDEEFAMEYLKITLNDFASDILFAKTGIEAIELCKTNPDIAIILMDVRMPEMNGYEATRKIREFNKDVFILAQTAYAQTGDREKALDAGCNHYITKPINKDELLKIISSRL